MGFVFVKLKVKCDIAPYPVNIQITGELTL
jgi:hypothetical protein